MDVLCKVTVFFEDPFWVGVYQRRDGKRLEVAKIVFGAEPKDYEGLETISQTRQKLRFSPPVVGSLNEVPKLNPKRMHRAINRQLSASGVGTKAQQALKIQQEQNKQLRKSNNRVKTEEEMKRKFELRQQKKKEKQKGR